MFLTKDDFQESIEIMESYEEITSQSDVGHDLLENYAREFFADYDKLIEANKKQILEMIMEDISQKIEQIN